MHKEGSTTYEDDENYRDPTGFVEVVEFTSPSSDTLILNISYNPHPDEDRHLRIVVKIPLAEHYQILQI